MVRAPSALGSLLGPAKPKAEARTAVDGTLEGHRAAMRLRDVLHDRKAQAGSGKLARVVRSPEAVKNTGRVLRGDAGTVIAHRDLAARDSHLNGCTGRAVLRGVVEKIGDRPCDADLHAIDRGRHRGHVKPDTGVPEPHVIDDFVDDVFEAQFLERHRGVLVARDLYQVVEERGHPLHLSNEVTEELLPLDRIFGLPAFQELEICAKARERGAELVRGIGDELALRAKRHLELPEHRVEARTETAELVAAFRRDTPGEIPRAGDFLDRGGEPLDRRQRRPSVERAEQTTQKDRAYGEGDQEQPRLSQDAINELEILDRLDGAAVLDRHDED